MLRYIGHASPECLLTLGSPLNIEAPVPEGVLEDSEDVLTTMVVQQQEVELDYYGQHKRDTR